MSCIEGFRYLSAVWQAVRAVLIATGLCCMVIDASVADPLAAPPDFCPKFAPDRNATRAIAVEIASATAWEPIGGEVRFTLSVRGKAGDAMPPPGSVQVAFGWHDADNKSPCTESPRIRYIGADTSGEDKVFTYAATVPDLDRTGLNGSHSGFDPRPSGLNHWHPTEVVPRADMYVMASFKEEKDFGSAIAPVGISTPFIAAFWALASLALIWVCIYRLGRSRGIPGNWLLGIISTPGGVASLSQFQIAIWTLVIGTGMIYVMTLTGSLITIPATTLALLGVTGFALVGAKVQANNDGTPQRASVPGAVTGLAVSGKATDSTVTLAWTPPAGGLQALAYTVQCRLAGAGPWTDLASGIPGPSYTVSGLDAGTTYDFRVIATNLAGQGPDAVLTGIATAPRPAAASPAAAPTSLVATADSDCAVSLEWAAPGEPAQSGYIVKYRRAGTQSWATWSIDAKGKKSGITTKGEIIVSGLEAARSYEFEISAGPPDAPSPAASALARTNMRKPKWSDLVMSNSSPGEVDLSRVQMLLFTAIVALFTALKLVESGEIPVIDSTVLALVGLSNGVYLASKVAGSQG